MTTKFAKWLNDQGISQNKFSKQIGVTRQVVSLWYEGARAPRLAHAVAIVRAAKGAVAFEDLLMKGEKMPKKATQKRSGSVNGRRLA